MIHDPHPHPFSSSSSSFHLSLTFGLCFPVPHHLISLPFIGLGVCFMFCSSFSFFPFSSLHLRFVEEPIDRRVGIDRHSGLYRLLYSLLHPSASRFHIIKAKRQHIHLYHPSSTSLPSTSPHFTFLHFRHCILRTNSLIGKALHPITTYHLLPPTYYDIFDLDLASHPSPFPSFSVLSFYDSEWFHGPAYLSSCKILHSFKYHACIARHDFHIPFRAVSGVVVSSGR